jgi:hypothetical protein
MGRKSNGSADNRTVSKRGSVALQVQRLREDEGVEEVMAILRAKPQLLGPTLHALRSGLLLPTENTAAQEIFSPCVIRYKDLPAYYIKHILHEFDSRVTMVALQAMAEKTKVNVNTFASQLFYLAVAVSPSGKLATRYRAKAELTMNLMARYEAAGKRLSKIELSDHDFSKAGVYAFSKEDSTSEVVTHVKHVAGIAVPVPPAANVTEAWTIKDNWLEQGAVAISADGAMQITLHSLFKNTGALTVGSGEVPQSEEAIQLGMQLAEPAASHTEGRDLPLAPAGGAGALQGSLVATPPPGKRARRADAK